MAINSTSEQRIAESLHLLHDRQVGVMTRLYHVKSTLESPDHRPAIMPGGDKTFDSAWKALLKQFPSQDFKSSPSAFQPFMEKQKENMILLSPYYYTFVEVLRVKDALYDLLGRIGYLQIQFDLQVNPDITQLYLELISNHFAICLLLTRICDSKAILALFNFFFDRLNGISEPDFPRMAVLVSETSKSILKLLHTDINPFFRSISKALSSIDELLKLRTVRVKNWTCDHSLDVLSKPNQIVSTSYSDNSICRLISYDVMERWVVFCSLLIYPELKEEAAFNRLKIALRNSCVVVLFRDEVVSVHQLFVSFLESPSIQKIGSKRISEIKEAYTIASTQAYEIHADRRIYLRHVLRHINLLIMDEPGLLGPRASFAFCVLSYAKDEINWIIRHSANQRGKKMTSSSTISHSGGGLTPDLKDPLLTELLFYTDELRLLIERYSFVIQRFYIQFLARSDCSRLSEQLVQLQHILPEEAVMILDGINKELVQLGQAEESLLTALNSESSSYRIQLPSFQPLRLDWLRLQVLLTNKKQPFEVEEHSMFFGLLHTIVFHSRLVDYIDPLLQSVSDLSIFLFYPNFPALFELALTKPHQHRFLAVYPALCSHVKFTRHRNCPEEQTLLTCKAVKQARLFCQLIAASLCQAVLMRVDLFGEMADQLTHSRGVHWLSIGDGVAKGTATSKRQPRRKSKSKAVAVPGIEHLFDESGLASKMLSDNAPIPGLESFRRDRAEMTEYDKVLFTITQLGQTVNYHTKICVVGEVIYPREILHVELEHRLTSLLSTYPIPQPSKGKEKSSTSTLVTKPSQLLRRVRALISVLLDLENHVTIDLIGILTSILAHQSQLIDGIKGEPTMTSHYCRWYREQLMRHAYANHFVYSPLLKSFVTMVGADVVPFRAEDYADLNELKALAQLIGPLGIRELCDQLIQDAVDRIDKLQTLVVENRGTLSELRCSNNDPVATKRLTACLQNSDTFLNLLKEIGLVLAFKRLCLEALNYNIETHIPFLLDTVKYLKARVGCDNRRQRKLRHPGDDQEAAYARLSRQLTVANLASTMGLFDDNLDHGLFASLNARQQAARRAAQQAGIGGQVAGTDYDVACLLVVFAASTLPSLARLTGSLYHVNLEANTNNCHCLVYSINALMVALFSLLRPGDIEDRSREFLALVSSNLLRLGLESSSASSDSSTAAQSTTVNCDSIYILFDSLVRQSPYLSHALQEACFPYSLIRTAYKNAAKQLSSGTSSLHKRSGGHQHDAAGFMPGMSTSYIQTK